ncbi:MAG: FeoB-associated Cys-rich membrane protein [Clostridia bacterium]|nr:FeoB-associated Cys-rich membrane protein [Clostridia bacterium]
MEDIVVIIIVAVIVVLAGLYIYKAKKSGKKCIGCPDAENCGKSSASSCGGNCSCCQGCKND